MPRKRNLYTNKSERDKPFKLSRSKVDLFLDCPRCFYIDRKKGIGRPPSFPFNLKGMACKMKINKLITKNPLSNPSKSPKRRFNQPKKTSSMNF